VSSSEFYLDILLVLLGIRWIYLGVFSSGEILEKVSRKRLWLIELLLHIAVKLFGEWITVINPENPFKEIDVDSNIEIFPSIMVF
jgi:hypothetical protein